MDELRKVRKVIERQAPGAPHETLLTIDATTGQNGLRQALLFREAVDVTGIVLTKLDGTAKGGIALAIAAGAGRAGEADRHRRGARGPAPIRPRRLRPGDPRAMSEPRATARASYEPGCRSPSRASRSCPDRCSLRRSTSPAIRRIAERLQPLRQSDLDALRGGGRRPRGRRGRALRLGHGRRHGAAPDARSGQARSWPRTPAPITGSAGSRRPIWNHAGSSCGWQRPPELAEAAQGADLLWLETPSNPNLEVYDIAALTEAAACRPWSTTPPRARCSSAHSTSALDFTLTSATKQMSGHADLMLGYVTTRDADAAQTLRNWRTLRRRHPRPVRDLARTPLAAHARAAAGARVATTPSPSPGCSPPATTWRLCAIPGSPRTPDTRWPSARCAAIGMVVSFDLGTAERAERFLASAELVTDATSFGSVHTCAERRARWGGDAVSEGFIRLSAGCEETADLLGDIERALDRRVPAGSSGRSL